jgi:hypothetical protein
MGIPHRHVFSCERRPNVREYIAAKACISRLSTCACLVARASHSASHDRSRLLGDWVAWLLFFAVLWTLRQVLPQLAILESVLGIRRVMAKVWKHVRQLRWCVDLPHCCPADLGELLHCPRYDVVLIPSEVAVARGEERGRLGQRVRRPD